MLNIKNNWKRKNYHYNERISPTPNMRGTEKMVTWSRGLKADELHKTGSHANYFITTNLHFLLDAVEDKVNFALNCCIQCWTGCTELHATYVAVRVCLQRRRKRTPAKAMPDNNVFYLIKIIDGKDVAHCGYVEIIDGRGITTFTLISLRKCNMNTFRAANISIGCIRKRLIANDF